MNDDEPTIGGLLEAGWAPVIVWLNQDEDDE